MAGWCAVFDVDWLIDPLGRAAKDGQVDWSAFRDTWLHVAHGVAQNGLPTLLLASFIPEHLDDLPGRAWVGDLHFLVLDCPDDANLKPVIDTTSQSPSQVADAVAAWVRDRLAPSLPA